MTHARPDTAQWRADAATLAAVADGDEGAFRRLYDAHHGRIVRIAFGITQDREVARDVAHDVMIKLFQVSARWTPRALVTTWLYRVTVRESLSWRRRWLRALHHEPDPPEPAAVVDVDAGRHRARLRAAMTTLGPRDRAIVVLHLDVELTPQAIAGVLGVTDNAARVALHRALERLRTAIGEAP